MGAKMLKMTLGFIFFCNLLTFVYSEDLLSQVNSEMEKIGNQEEKVAYLQGLGPRKIIILGSQVSKRHSLIDAYWVGHYGLAGLWEKDVVNVIASVPVIRGTELNLHKGWQSMLSNSISDYIKRINLSTEAKLINEALKFIGNESNPVLDRVQVIDFIWDVWFGYLNEGLHDRKRAEIFDSLNKQSETIIENVFAIYPCTPELRDAKVRILKRFYQVYMQEEELPSSFKESSYFSEAQLKVQSVFQEAMCEESIGK